MYIFYWAHVLCAQEKRIQNRKCLLIIPFVSLFWELEMPTKAVKRPTSNEENNLLILYLQKIAFEGFLHNPTKILCLGHEANQKLP